jgi:hypothetical protein
MVASISASIAASRATSGGANGFADLLNQQVPEAAVMARYRDAALEQLQDNYLARLGHNRIHFLVDIVQMDPGMGITYLALKHRNLRDTWVRLRLRELGLSDQFDEDVRTV